MKIISVTQGSPEWLSIRAAHYCASEAAAMLGLSKYMTRSDLLRQKALGISPEIGAAKQRLFDAGHAAEAAARPIAEASIGDDLYPVTGTLDVDGLPLLASFDGLTMDETVAWENKLLNQSLVNDIANEQFAPHIWPQLEQQLLVSGADRLYFTTSDGAKESTHGTWYRSESMRRAQLIAGWKQFAADLANYQHIEVIPAAVAAPIKELPTLFIQARGEVTATNMPAFKAQITEFLGSINMKPATDQEFADGKEVAKKLRELAVKIKERKADMLAQTATIGEVATEIDHLAEVINANALELEKSVKREEDARKLAIISEGRAAFTDHIAALNTRIGKPYMPSIPADFAEVIKGKRLITAMQDVVATLLANKKIEASEIADRIDQNLKMVKGDGYDHTHLFPDLQSVCTKEPIDFDALLTSRQAKEKDRIEAEREKIRAEEEAKAAAKVKAEQEAAELSAKVKREEEMYIAAQERIAKTAESNTPATPASVPANEGTGETPALGQRETLSAAPVQSIHPAAPIDTGARIKLGEINTQLAPLSITTAGLAQLGIQPAGNAGAAVLFKTSDFPAICAAIIGHVHDVARSATLKAAA